MTERNFMTLNPTPRDAEYVDAYKRFGNQREAGLYCGVSRETIARACRRSGVKMDGRKFNGKGPRKNGTKPKITDEELSECAKHMTRQEIADKYGMHVGSVDRRMRKLGIHAIYAISTSEHYLISDIEMQKRVNDYTDGCWSYVKRCGSKKIEIQCNKCGAKATRDYGGLKRHHTTCAECSRRDQTDKVKQITFAIRECKHCGMKFLTTNETKLYCSPKCKVKNKPRNGSYRKRAQHYGVYFDPTISLKKIIERDRNICQICGKPCDTTDTSWGASGPMYPSIDHIVAFANGGAHTWDNVQLVHIICNSYKRDLKCAKEA